MYVYIYSIYVWLNTKLFYKLIPALLQQMSRNSLETNSLSYIKITFQQVCKCLIMVRQKAICGRNQIFNYTFMTVLLDL